MLHRFGLKNVRELYYLTKRLHWVFYQTKTEKELLAVVCAKGYHTEYLRDPYVKEPWTILSKQNGNVSMVAWELPGQLSLHIPLETKATTLCA